MLSLNKTYRFIILVISFGYYESNSQNLISNPSFERVDTPVYWNSGTFINNSHFPATRNVTDWDMFNSSDYFSTNVPYTGVFRGIPINDFGNSYPKHGNAYGGFISYYRTGETKEYIYQNLSTPLIQDSVYCISFFVSRADGITNAIHSIGANSTTSAPTMTNVYISALPQVVNQNGFITDTIGWTEIKGCFTAQGGEQFVTIGNFNSNTNTDTLFVGSVAPIANAPGYAYYYIDSVSLWKNNFPTLIKENNKDEFVSFYPNPAKDVVNFKFEDAIEKRKIAIYDAIGNLIYEKEIKSNNLTLTTDNLANGIYIYRILVNGIIVNTNKIVIIK